MLFAAALFGIGRGVVGAVHPLNSRYWDGSNDFQWSPSRVLLGGTDPYALYKELGRANNAGLGAPFILSQWADYPPSSLMILWPLAALPWHIAKWSWLAINLLCIAVILGCCLHLMRHAKHRSEHATQHLSQQSQRQANRDLADIWRLRLSGGHWLVLLFLACPSVSSTLKSGQHGLFSIAAFLLAVVVWKSSVPLKQRTALTGVLLALSWLKYTMTLPLSLFFLVRERKPVFLIAAVLHVLATLFAAVWTNTSPIELLRGNLEIASGNLGVVAFDLSQLVAHIGLEGYALVASVLSAMMLLAVQNASDDSDLETLSMLGFLSFLMLPHLRYDLYLLVIPLAFALSKQGTTVARWILLSVVQLWFVRETIETVVGQRPEEYTLRLLVQFTIGVSLLLLYTPMLLSWWRLLPRLDELLSKCRASSSDTVA